MDTFDAYLEKIEDGQKRKRVEDIFTWVEKNYPELDKRIAWSHPIFTHHDTFIISFSSYKKHLSISPENKAIQVFEEEIKKRGLKAGKMEIQFPWDKEFDYALLKMLMDYNIEDKKDWKKFWR